jgi:flagellar biosynthesis regulator FlbT
MNSATILNEELKNVRNVLTEFDKLVEEGKYQEACRLVRSHLEYTEEKLKSFIL